MRPGWPRSIFGIRRPGGEERDEEKKREREEEKKRRREEAEKRTFSRRRTNWCLRLLSKAKLGECSGRGGRLWGQEKKRARERDECSKFFFLLSVM